MEKDDVRQRVWDDLDATGVARFPFPPHGRIPNFAGANEAAERLANQSVWEDATAIKINPDSPQRLARSRALADGKRIYMAVPRLQAEQPFLELDPDRIDDPSEASTIGGANEYGNPVSIDEMTPIDLIVSGSVAVDEHGTRIGKGEGYSDLEYAILLEAGLIDGDTPVATTVHERQVCSTQLPHDPHDVPLEVIVTPDRTISVETTTNPPIGIDWSLLEAETIQEMPVLQRLQEY